MIAMLDLIRRRLDRSERGSVLLFVVVFVFALLLAVGFVVDGSGRMNAVQRAESVAREAARFAGQAMTSDAVRGTGTTINPAAGRAAAQRYLAAADVTGTVTIVGSTVHVETRVAFEPVLLTIIGLGRVTVTGEADSAPANVLNGER